MLINYINKYKFLIIFIFLICITLLVTLNVKKNSNIKNVEAGNIQDSIIEYDNETKLYYIKDKETDRIIIANYDKNVLQFYIDHPDYLNSDLSAKSSNIKDYVYDDFEGDELLYNE